MWSLSLSSSPSEVPHNVVLDHEPSPRATGLKRSPLDRYSTAELQRKCTWYTSVLYDSTALHGMACVRSKHVTAMLAVAKNKGPSPRVNAPLAIVVHRNLWWERFRSRTHRWGVEFGISLHDTLQRSQCDRNAAQKSVVNPHSSMLQILAHACVIGASVAREH